MGFVRKCCLFICGVALILPVVLVAEDRPTVPGGVKDKPYIKRAGRGTFVGGYMDHELFWNEKKKTFDQHRFIPFIYGEVSDRIHVTSEIEFEHGGLVKGKGESDGEVKLEFATLDIQFSEALSYRGGVILSPLGKFNLIHDSPLNDLSNRPLVARKIIPTTLSEAGMGFYGTLYPTVDALIGYEIYVVNGFNGKLLEADSENGYMKTSIRSGRGSQKTDNNDSKSIVGRLNYSPFLGLDIGGSFHRGAYDDAGNNQLMIVAADVTYTNGPIDLLGEYAAASIDGSDDDSQSGLYAQVGYHFLPGAFKAFPNSIFTAVLRYDRIDLKSSDETRYTVGINFRPEEDTVLKLDYEKYDVAKSDGLIFSVASYF